jgi:RHS repeat-associated protein
VFTDEFGYQLRLVKDATETVVKVLRPDGREEAFEYGLTDELKTITNSKAETAGFQYDPAGRCTRVTYFDSRQDAFVYDEADNPTALLDGHTGEVLARCQYVDDELVEESYCDGRMLKIEYGPSREIVGAENSDAALSYERDALRRVTTARANGLELQYAYNLRGDCVSLTLNTGRRIDYEWDGRGRLISMSDSSSGTYGYSYDARDLCIESRMPNGCTQHFKYDRRHRMISRRVTRPNGSEICSREFTYDVASRLVAYVDSVRGTRRYSYDSMDLLTSVSDNGEVSRFQHDSNGNLLMTRTGDVAAYAAGDRAVRIGSDELGYDERGNLSLWRSKNGESRFEYTGEGWLKRALLANGTVAEYEYDPMARRTAKTVDGLRTEFDWDGVHLVGERTAGEVIDYLIMPGSFFLTGVTRGARHYSYVFDQLGTPTELIDEAGEIVWAADFDPHGEVTAVRVNKVAQPFRFLGQYYDDELTWHYNRFRYYSPVLGRFTSPDPLCFAAGINLYRYAPNPVNWVDPFGLSFATPAAGRTPATCEVMSKCDWGDEMMEEAEKKMNGVNKGTGCQAIITGPCDRPPDQKDYYMANCVDDEDKAKVEKALKTQNNSCKSQQVDHIKEVQCGGINECKNLTPLTQTVNGSFGSQIKNCRDQLAAKGVTGIVKMKIKLVSIRDADAATLKNHDRKPCEDDDTRCP